MRMSNGSLFAELFAEFNYILKYTVSSPIGVIRACKCSGLILTFKYVLLKPSNDIFSHIYLPGGKHLLFDNTVPQDLVITSYLLLTYLKYQEKMRLYQFIL